MRILGFIVLVVLILPACKRDCRKVVDSYENGREKVVHEMQDCSDSTTYTRFFYHENGQLGSEVQYANGFGNGKCKSWYENGVLSAEWEMLNGKQSGPFKCWEENGTLYKRGTTKNGLEDGKIEEWFDDGVYVKRQYRNGIREGHSYETGVDSSENKRYIVVGTNNNGKKDGIWKWFLGDSVLSFTKTYKNGVEMGEYTFYYPNGHIDHSGLLDSGECTGEWKFYDTAGRLMELRYYDKGKRIRTKKI